MKKLLYICLFILAIFIFADKGFLIFDFNKKDETGNIEVLNDISMDNYSKIKIGDIEESVVQKIGNPNRKDLSEYGFRWYVYNNIKNKFAMVGVLNKKVVALYSNSINSSDLNGIKIGDSMKLTRKKHSPIKYKKKGNIKFIIDSKGQFDIFKEGNKYITVFYDLYNKEKIVSYQIIDKEVEENLKYIYPQYSKELKTSFEKESLDLINSTRDKNNLSRLNFNLNASISAVKHSEDMKNNNFFDHENKKGESPFDRMKRENIKYSLAGENIAAGQINAIYAHEALMNSMGHRKNILGDYKNVGVGVSFGGHYKLYYTQNFFNE